jgi:hypothetical protein
MIEYYDFTTQSPTGTVSARFLVKPPEGSHMIPFEEVEGEIRKIQNALPILVFFNFIPGRENAVLVDLSSSSATRVTDPLIMRSIEQTMEELGFSNAFPSKDDT